LHAKGEMSRSGAAENPTGIPADINAVKTIIFFMVRRRYDFKFTLSQREILK
jgi:hypothetical protein